MKIFFSITIIFFLSACTSNAFMELEQSGQGSLTFQTEASDEISSIIRSFSGAENSVNIFDKEAIRLGFSKTDIGLVSLSSAGNTDISIVGNFQDVSSLESMGIVFETSTQGSSLTINVNEKTMGSLLSLLGEESLLYIELLQAPLFTGEDMTSSEYLDFIGALYGDSLASEMENAKVRFEVLTPVPVEEVVIEPSSVGFFDVSDNRVFFDLSLYKILSIREDLFFRIQW